MRSKYLATALAVTAPFIGGGCGGAGSNSPEQTWRVGNPEWVRVDEDITQHYADDDKTLKAGEICVLNQGAELVLRDGDMYYSDENAEGTVCPDGAEVDISVRQANNQDRQFRAFAQRRKKISDQIKDMRVVIGSRITPARGWVDVVNPSPIEQRYSGIAGTPSSETLVYGDNCATQGHATSIGHLATGQTVMRISNPGQVGTSCPTGTLYLAPPGPR